MMKVRKWEIFWRWMTLVSIAYLITSTIPLMVKAGVYLGIVLTVGNGLFWLYARHLVKNGKGDEKRP